MHRLTLIAVVVLSAVIVMRQPVASTPFASSEQARLRAHFDSAEREVRGHLATGLSITQRAARMRALDRVHAYAARGVFPRNRDFPGRLVPYFIDRITGTRCGMAYLIEESGDAGFVARVAATNNNAVISDLKDDPEMVAWLERNGLTLDEAARIQPSYGCEGTIRPPCPSASTGYKTATGMAVGVDVLAVAANLIPSPRSRTISGDLGVVSGLIGIGIGAPNLHHSGSRRTYGLINVGVGAVSAAFGLYRLAQTAADIPAVHFSPWFSSNGASGLSGRITF